MKHIYSYNGSKVHLKMNEELADAYNRAMNAWFQAQKDFEKVHGRKVTVEEIKTLKIRATETEFVAWNKISDHMNHLYETGLVLTMDECPSSYLEKLD